MDSIQFSHDSDLNYISNYIPLLLLSPNGSENAAKMPETSALLRYQTNPGLPRKREGTQRG